MARKRWFILVLKDMGIIIAQQLVNPLKPVTNARKRKVNYQPSIGLARNFGQEKADLNRLVQREESANIERNKNVNRKKN